MHWTCSTVLLSLGKKKKKIQCINFCAEFALNQDDCLNQGSYCNRHFQSMHGFASSLLFIHERTNGGQMLPPFVPSCASIQIKTCSVHFVSCHFLPSKSSLALPQVSYFPSQANLGCSQSVNFIYKYFSYAFLLQMMGENSSEHNIQQISTAELCYSYLYKSVS